MVMPAPGLFSITIGWPSRGESFSPMARATMSTPPPGGNGAMKRIGFAGYGCASVGSAAASSNAAATVRRDSVFILGRPLLCEISASVTPIRRHGVARIARMVVIDAQHRNMPAHHALDEHCRVSWRQYRPRRPPATDELDDAACASSPRALAAPERPQYVSYFTHFGILRAQNEDAVLVDHIVAPQASCRLIHLR